MQLFLSFSVRLLVIICVCECVYDNTKSIQDLLQFFGRHLKVESVTALVANQSI